MRRRQRSVRVTIAVALLSAASAAVVASLPTRSVLWLGLASVTALALSWAGLRLMWTEVLQSRRENAADRAAEHAEFTTAMTDRLAQAHISQRELEGLIVQHETRAQRAESKLAAEIGAHAETQGRVRQLEEAMAAMHADDGSVVDLVTWDEQTKKAGPKTAQKKARALKQA